LLKHGAKIDAKDEVGRTPLHLAASYGKVRYMYAKGRST